MSAQPLAVLAVDDEEPALDDLSRLLSSLESVGHVESVSSGGEALRRLGQERFDAVLLDVRMPDLDGLELARVLRRFERRPAVIFVSAYETGAVDAFELEALDYLMKPVSRERLEQAVARVEREPRKAATNGASSSERPAPEAERPLTREDLVPVHTGRGGTRLLPRASILYIEAQGDYVRIVADSGRFLLRGRISDIEHRWRGFGFVRTHRGYIANLRRAVEVRPRLNGSAGLVFPAGDEIPIARRKANELRRLLSV